MGKKILIVGDTHIEENSIQELMSIFDNDIYSIKADEVIQLGDLFNKNRPTPRELRFATKLIHGLTTVYKKVTLLAGNGSHEFLNNVAVIEYLKELSGKIKIRTEEYFVEDNIYYGHHMINESKLEYGTGRCGLKDLKKYNFAFLGHQHNTQDFNKKVFHVGSIRYQHFNEVTDKFKRVALVEDDKVKFIELKCPFKMVDVHSIKELEDVESTSKVRLVISSFKQFKKEINSIDKYKNNFEEFKVKLDFDKTASVKNSKKDSRKLEQILNDGIKQVKDKDVRELLQECFKW